MLCTSRCSQPKNRTRAKGEQGRAGGEEVQALTPAEWRGKDTWQATARQSHPSYQSLLSLCHRRTSKVLGVLVHGDLRPVEDRRLCPQTHTVSAPMADQHGTQTSKHIQPPNHPTTQTPKHRRCSHPSTQARLLTVHIVPKVHVKGGALVALGIDHVRPPRPDGRVHKVQPRGRACKQASRL